MDPRHPEQAIARMRELMKQYDRIEADMNNATTSARLAELEREGGLVIQEICLVAPRIHEAMMQTSRERRYSLARGLAEKPVHKWSSEEKVAEVRERLEKAINEVEEEAQETPVEKPKPKKKTTKKKTTKKAKK